MWRLFDSIKNKPVGVVKVTLDEDIQKEIFCMNEDECYWSKEEYARCVQKFNAGGVVFGDAGYETSVNINDYVIKVSDTYNLPVKQEEINRLGITIYDKCMHTYAEDIIKAEKSSDISKRDLQILAALLGEEQLCIRYGLEYLEDNKKTSELEDVDGSVTISVKDLKIVNDFIERHMPQSMIIEGTAVDKFESNLKYVKDCTGK